MRWRRTLPAVVVVVLMSALGGCMRGHDAARDPQAALDCIPGYRPVAGGAMRCEPDVRPGPIPVSAPDSFGPGHAIADGFAVPRGTLLVGGVVATGSHASGPSGPVVDHGWSALLEVTGDPRPVLTALVAQAHQAGITMAPSPYPAPGGAFVDTGNYCSMGDTVYGRRR